MEKPFDKKSFYNSVFSSPLEERSEPKSFTDALSSAIDATIRDAVAQFSVGNETQYGSFEELISMGELVDRLSIVNFKLYMLKDEVMDRQNDTEFGAWASVQDVKLVMERARLKKCIDEKLLSMISKVNSGDNTGGFNSEVKKYGSL